MRVQQSNPRSQIARFSDRKILIASLAVAFGLAKISVPACATSIVVNTCDDGPATDGVVTLRSAIAAANADPSNTLDTIDLTKLECSTITLQDGSLGITAANLTVLGPTSHALTIDAHGTSRVFFEYEPGALAIDDLTLTNGYVSLSDVGGDNGGCVESWGALILNDCFVTNCRAEGSGGGVHALYGLQVHNSVVTGNAATSGGGIASSANTQLYSSTVAFNHARTCGGILVNGTVLINDSSVNANSGYYSFTTNAQTYYHGTGGGVCGTTMTLNRSEVYGNYARGNAAGIYGTTITLNDTTVTGNKTGSYYGRRGTAHYGLSAVGGVSGLGSVTLNRSTIDNNYAPDIGAISANNLTITNSTVSGNRQIQGANLSCNNLSLQNSTVAFNYTQTDFAGIFVAVSAQITSSILARNHAQTPSGADDLAVATGSPVSVAASLITSSYPAGLGAITSDPQLAPLANHGGLTRTHALLATSPAIGVGSNPENLTTDQRNSGFARSLAGKTDIGAYQRQPHDDEVFYAGFDP